jgi:hypothetical protein
MKPIIDMSYYQEPAEINYGVLVGQISGAIIRATYSNWKDGQIKRGEL